MRKPPHKEGQSVRRSLFFTLMVVLAMPGIALAAEP